MPNDAGSDLNVPLSLFLLPIIPRRHSCDFFKYLREMCLAGKAQKQSNGRDGFIRIAKEALGFLRFFVSDISGKRYSGITRKAAGEVLSAQIQMVGNLIGCDRFREMPLDIK